jgi:hypothetical protein
VAAARGGGPRLGADPFRAVVRVAAPGACDPASAEAPVALDCGVRLRGSIDLVEASVWGAVRATDYKTGKVRAQRDAVISGGETLQPVLYALALEKLMPPGTLGPLREGLLAELIGDSNPCGGATMLVPFAPVEVLAAPGSGPVLTGQQGWSRTSAGHHC